MAGTPPGRAPRGGGVSAEALPWPAHPLHGAADRTAARARGALFDDGLVWLDAGVQQLVSRVRAGDHRPLLTDDPATVLSRMQRDRAPLYREIADLVIDVDGQPVDDIVAFIAAAFEDAA